MCLQFGATAPVLHCPHLSPSPPPATLLSHSTDREVAAVALLGFVAYQLAELLHLSGIFSVFFCGIVMRWVGHDGLWVCG